MFRTKSLISSLALMAILFCSSSAYSQLFINGATTTAGIGPSESVFLFSSGSSVVDAFSFDVQFPAANSPTVVNITAGQGPFSGGTNTFTPAVPLVGAADQASFSLPTSTTVSTGVLAEIVFDTTNLSDGDTFTFFVPNPVASNGGVEVETAVQLQFDVTVQSIPEPSSATVLLALGSVFMMRRKRV